VNFIQRERTDDIEQCVARVKRIFQSTKIDDEDVQADSTEKMALTTNCPTTLAMMKLPARGELCDHLQCFDLNTYLNMNAKYKKWQCPICIRKCFYPTIDSYFSKMIDLVRAALEKEPKMNEKVQLDENLNVFMFNERTKQWTKFAFDLGKGRYEVEEGEIDNSQYDSTRTKSGTPVSENGVEPPNPE